MRMVDLSATIGRTPETTPEYSAIGITYRSHAEGATQVSGFQVPKALLRREEGWATELITHLETHGTTHVDAPWHYNSTIQGKEAQTIDELPLEWFFADGVKLNFCAKEEGDCITVEDIEKELQRINYNLKPLDIVLMHTGRDVFCGREDYIFMGCGVTASATHWLYDRGIRVTGIDAWGWDQPLHLQAQEAVARNEKGIFWAAHQVDLPYCHMERLVNLRSLPSCGFKVACFPLKIERGSGAPARVVAILPD
jgi:kynurenine formamidase